MFVMKAMKKVLKKFKFQCKLDKMNKLKMIFIESKIIKYLHISLTTTLFEK